MGHIKVRVTVHSATAPGNEARYDKSGQHLSGGDGCVRTLSGVDTMCRIVWDEVGVVPPGGLCEDDCGGIRTSGSQSGTGPGATTMSYSSMLQAQLPTRSAHRKQRHQQVSHRETGTWPKHSFIHTNHLLASVKQYLRLWPKLWNCASGKTLGIYRPISARI